MNWSRTFRAVDYYWFCQQILEATSAYGSGPDGLLKSVFYTLESKGASEAAVRGCEEKFENLIIGSNLATLEGCYISANVRVLSLLAFTVNIDAMI